MQPLHKMELDSIPSPELPIPDPSFFQRTIAAQIHLFACFLSIIGTVFLIDKCARVAGHNHVWACLIFGISSTLLFATSSVYHFLYDGFRISKSLEARLENFDHLAIYLFIAGTYTPVLMNAVANPWANILLAMVWGLAVLGAFYTLSRDRLPKWAQHRFVYTGIFLLIGWLFFLRIGEIVHNLSNLSLFYFTMAGLCYTAGAIVYATKRPTLFKNIFGFHELWHVLVIFGYGFHYLVILNFY
jgi:hemolysin III